MKIMIDREQRSLFRKIMKSQKMKNNLFSILINNANI